jgi:HK97 family phage major capsid protein
MSTLLEIKNAIDEQLKAFEAFKETNDQRLDAVKKGNESLAKELEAKLGKIEKDVTESTKKKTELELELKIMIERLEELESRAAQPKGTAAERAETEYKDAVMKWLRSPGNQMLEQKIIDVGKRIQTEHKDITVGSQPDGGYGLPKEIVFAIRDLERKFSPVRDLVAVEQTGTTDYNELLGIDGQTSGWAGETTTRSATSTPQLRNVKPTYGELYAYPTASQWSLDDLGFSVENWLTKNVAKEFSIQEGIAVISGNGTNKPTGMTNTTPVTTADWASPLRAAAAYQYIACQNSPVAISMDCLITLVYTLNKMYRAGSSFVMNSLTTAAVRKLKDSSNQYLWQPSNQAGQPDTLLGYPVACWEDLQDIGSNNFPVAFGNFKEGYVLAERIGMRILRDNLTTPGFVKFYVSRREGGIVRNNDAIKFLRTT